MKREDTIASKSHDHSINHAKKGQMHPKVHTHV